MSKVKKYAEITIHTHTHIYIYIFSGIGRYQHKYILRVYTSLHPRICTQKCIPSILTIMHKHIHINTDRSIYTRIHVYLIKLSLTIIVMGNGTSDLSQITGGVCVSLEANALKSISFLILWLNSPVTPSHRRSRRPWLFLRGTFCFFS